MLASPICSAPHISSGKQNLSKTWCILFVTLNELLVCYACATSSANNRTFNTRVWTNCSYKIWHMKRIHKIIIECIFGHRIIIPHLSETAYCHFQIKRFHSRHAQYLPVFFALHQNGDFPCFFKVPKLQCLIKPERYGKLGLPFAKETVADSRL